MYKVIVEGYYRHGVDKRVCNVSLIRDESFDSYNSALVAIANSVLSMRHLISCDSPESGIKIYIGGVANPRLEEIDRELATLESQRGTTQSMLSFYENEICLLREEKGRMHSEILIETD